MTQEKIFSQKSIEFIKGVGQVRAQLLGKELGIFTTLDMLQYYPSRYEDRSKIVAISQINSEEIAYQFVCKIKPIGIVGAKQGRRFIALATDSSGSIELVWFNGINWIEKNIDSHKNYIVFGKPQRFGNSINLVHPELDEYVPEKVKTSAKLAPVYPLTEALRKRRMESKMLRQIASNVLELPDYFIPENLPVDWLKTHAWPSKMQAIKIIHKPQNEQEIETAIARTKFEELFYLQLRHQLGKSARIKNSKGPIFSKIGNLFNDFYHLHLPFPLTNAQKRVIKEIRQDMQNGKQMNRLLQGDVGSGKTIVALLSMLIALDNGYQACLMAPTEILAVQHFNSIQNFLFALNIQPKLLTGSTKKKERESILFDLKNGSLPILIGTHALIEQVVEFHNLGIAIIDEQHRFGVAQRAQLQKKGIESPHVLVMTATPIPRTLAMTVYGDLDVSIIDELPVGRKQIKTILRHSNIRPLIMEFVAQEIKKGRQAYFVFPLIEESEKLNLVDLQTGFEMVWNYLPQPEYTYASVHGRMKPDEKDAEMQRFKKGQAQIMLATTVIEVGVDVPNATVMIIENANRFGLAQLHQLRGRVGRGADQSYCILVAGNALSKEAKKRLETMVKTTDGFEIAKVDMELRGFGDMDGTRQSGDMDLHLADVFKDEKLLQLAQQYAILIAEQDPLLMKSEHIGIRNYILSQKQKVGWSKIL